MAFMGHVGVKSIWEHLQVSLWQSKRLFGYLRDGNILYSQDTGRVYLIDSDWAENEGTRQYPATLNSYDVDWFPDVSLTTGPMMKHYDILIPT